MRLTTVSAAFLVDAHFPPVQVTCDAWRIKKLGCLVATSDLPPNPTPITELLRCRSLLWIFPRVDYIVCGDYRWNPTTYLLRLPKFSVLVSSSPFAKERFTHWNGNSIFGCRHGTGLWLTSTKIPINIRQTRHIFIKKLISATCLAPY